MEKPDFVWILVGGYEDAHSGENKRYALVEYSVETESLSLSNLTNTCVPWTDISNLYREKQDKVYKMIEEGKRFLCRTDNEKYGYVRNIFNGKYIFTDEENEDIKDKLRELVFYKCVK